MTQSCHLSSVQANSLDAVKHGTPMISVVAYTDDSIQHSVSLLCSVQ